MSSRAPEQRGGPFPNESLHFLFCTSVVSSPIRTIDRSNDEARSVALQNTNYCPRQTPSHPFLKINRILTLRRADPSTARPPRSPRTRAPERERERHAREGSFFVGESTPAARKPRASLRRQRRRARRHHRARRRRVLCALDARRSPRRSPSARERARGRTCITKERAFSREACVAFLWRQEPFGRHLSLSLSERSVHSNVESDAESRLTMVRAAER